jgi:hypothetical protein
MAELYKLPISDQGRENNNLPDQQLSLLFDTQPYAGNLVCAFEKDIQPSNIADLMLREGINCIADLRHVPYFSGDEFRHKEINEILNERGIPVFHVGVAYFTAIDQSLPNSIKMAQLSALMDSSERIHDTVLEHLSSGACLIILEDSPDVVELAKNLISLVSSMFDNAQIRLNKTWSHISTKEHS